jgi:hypothetical protein
VQGQLVIVGIEVVRRGDTPVTLRSLVVTLHIERRKKREVIRFHTIENREENFASFSQMHFAPHLHTETLKKARRPVLEGSVRYVDVWRSARRRTESKDSSQFPLVINSARCGEAI